MFQTLLAHLTEIAVAAGAVVFVAFVGGATTNTGRWYQTLRFPALKPPDWAFGPGWSLIFAFIATAGVVAWNDAPDAGTRTVLLALFAVNAVLNLAWSPLYFTLRRPDWALLELVPFWASILALILFTSGFSPRAAWLLAPYLAWVSFAGWLNWQVVQLNAPFSARGGAE
jgi:tryptophan-rich sensory protein